MPLWNDDDPSISSVFDWGSVPGRGRGSASGGGSSDRSPPAEPDGASSLTDDVRGNGRSDAEGPSRYDPSTMNRITDITDLVDEDTESDDDTIVGQRTPAKAAKQKRSKPLPGAARTTLHRQVVVLVSLVSVIAAAGMGVMFAIKNGAEYAAGAGGGGEARGLEQQRLLEIAQRVLTVCSEDQLDEDMSDCQEMCKPYICCFEEEEEYSCEDDEDMDCAVFAGCEALIV